MARCLEYDEYLNDLVFYCPLDKPCNQQLTHADFLKHAHQDKKTEKKKPTKKTAPSHHGSSHDDLGMSSGKSQSKAVSNTQELYPENRGHPSATDIPNFELPKDSCQRKHSPQQPGITGSSLYPGKEME